MLIVRWASSFFNNRAGTRPAPTKGTHKGCPYTLNSKPYTLNKPCYTTYIHAIGAKKVGYFFKIC